MKIGKKIGQRKGTTTKKAGEYGAEQDCRISYLFHNFVEIKLSTRLLIEISQNKFDRKLIENNEQAN